MIDRPCKGCGKIFRVMLTSKQLYHSQTCELDGKIWEGYENHLQKNKESLEIKKTVNVNVQNMPVTQFTEKEKSKGVSFSGGWQENHIQKKLRQKKELEKINGSIKISSDAENITGDTMQNTELNLPEKLKSQSVIEIHPSDSKNYSEALKKEQLGSMIFLNESTKQLQKAMNQIVSRHEGSETRTLNAEEIHSVAEIAATIALTIRVKNESMKIARKMQRTEA